MIELRDALTRFGLSEKESNAYLAMLELGPASVQEIAKKSNANRATMYALIEGLKRRGLVSSVEREKKTIFTAESPERLLGIVSEEVRETLEKKQKLEGLMPQFLALFNAVEDKPKVRFYEGEEGMDACRTAMLELSRDSGLVRIFIHYDLEMIALAKYNEAQRLRLTHRLGGMRVLYSLDPDLELPSFGRNGDMKRVPTNVLGFTGECNVYEHFILIATAKPRPVSVIIENPGISRLFQSFFDLAWMGAETMK